MVTLNVNGVRREVRRPTKLRCFMFCAMILSSSARSSAAAWHSAEPVPFWWKARKRVLRNTGGERREPGNHHARGSARAMGQAKRAFGGASEGYAPPGAASLDRRADAAMRVLPERHDDQSYRTSGKQSRSDFDANQKAFTKSGRRLISAGAELTSQSLRPYNMPPRSWRRGAKRWQPPAKSLHNVLGPDAITPSLY